MMCDVDKRVYGFNDAGDGLTIRDLFTGILCLGGPGCGKSSCIGALFRMIFLMYHFGGMVLCVKPGEARAWIEAATRCGRGGDIIHVTKDGGLCFNPLMHEMRRGGGGGNVNNIVSLLSTLQNVGQPMVTSNGDAAGKFFKDSTEQCEGAAISLLVAAGEDVSLPNIRGVINSLPEFVIPEDPAMHTAEVTDWLRDSYSGKLIARAADRRSAGEIDEDAWRAAEYATDFLGVEFSALASQTRTSIKQTFSSCASKLMSPPFDRLLGGKCTYVPEQMFLGKIIILDVPTTEHGESGVLLQVANKLAAQRAIQRRDVGEYPRPVFIYADEFQVFSVPQDADFQEICRESRGIVCYLTQNLQNIARRLHEHVPGSGTLSLIGNIQNRIFLQNGEDFTNKWAADSFGKQHEDITEGGSKGFHFRQDYRYVCEPATFSSLPTPTAQRPYAVGIVYRGGQPWNETGMPYLTYAFPRV
jgi:hypothetical protein